MPNTALEKVPLFLIRSSAGKVNHLFPIGSSAVDKILKNSRGVGGGSNKKLVEISETEATLFGSISADGCLQIWDLLKRRPILTFDTQLPTTSWTELCIRTKDIQQELEFFIYSRRSGLFCHYGESIQKNSLVHLPLEDVHAGFCKPVLLTSDVLVCPCGSDSIAKISGLDTKTPTLETIPVAAPVTFLQCAPGQDLVLAGTEDGKVSVLSMSSPSSVTASYDLNEHKPSDSSEDHLIPLCCDGDEDSGHYLIGTQAEDLVLLKLENKLTETQEQETIASDILSLVKDVRLHRRGTACITLRPDGNVVVVAGWDTLLRVFSFPDLKQLATLSCHSSTISSLLFVSKSRPGSAASASPSESELELELEESSASTSRSKRILKNTPVAYYLLSSSHDSTVAVWDDLFSDK